MPSWTNAQGRNTRIIAFCIVATLLMSPVSFARNVRQPQLESRGTPILVLNGLRFRDLDRDGALTPYEDWRLDPAARARDLVSRMSVPEKVGAMVHATAPTQIPGGMGSEYDFAAAATLIDENRITALLTRVDAAARVLADQHNRLQEIAERTRLGIPLTLSSDPRHHFFSVFGASSRAVSFSQWPDAPGLAAINDPRVTRQFGDIARQEYRAVGIHMALSPQADLASEPRWPRVIGTFGDDPERVGRQVAAYIEGLQHGDDGLRGDSVIAVVKHWFGYGAALDGLDSHSYIGRFADLSHGHFEDHVRPFEYAFDVNVAGVMPAYSILQGLQIDGAPVEQVGVGFNQMLVTNLLRGRYGFDGMILSDSGIVDDCHNTCMGEPGPPGQIEIGMPWGVEELTRVQRIARAINAGVDQILGLDAPNQISQALQEGLVSEAQIDAACIRILEQKFAIGLFEDPFVDVEAAERIVGSPAFRRAGLEAQRRSFVTLDRRAGLLPLRRSARLLLHGVDPGEARRRGFEVVSDPADATIAIVRANTPFERLYPNFFIASFQHNGDLDFKASDPALEAINAAAAHVPVIVDVNLDRAGVLANIRGGAAVLLVDFGASDGALLDVLTGEGRASGVLPFELPSSMDAVREQESDAPHDSVAPLYPTGYRWRQ